MSWSISTVLEGEDADVLSTNAIDELSAIDRTNIGNSDCIKERDEQIEAAIYVTSQLLAAGGFNNAKEVSVSISGHANPEHNTRSGWSNESITVTVAVKSYR